jgi:hypothetical protein
LPKRSQEKKSPGRKPLGKDRDDTRYIGLKVPEELKTRLELAAMRLGLAETAELHRSILISWLDTFDRAS